MSTACRPTTIDFGRNFPDPTTLQTGDILFARATTRIELSDSLAIKQLLISSGLGQIKLGDYVGPDLVLRSALMARRTDLATQTYAIYARWSASALLEDAAIKFRLDRERIALIVAILMTEFPELTEDWFGLTLLQFFSKPLARLLLKVFAGDVRDSFFVGHCALVICEDDGLDPAKRQPYVVEANTTSFSHYGVAMHPYYIQDDGQVGKDRFRSWASFRASRGDSVWSARAKALINADPRTAERMRVALRRAAKMYLGRSYGLFDSSTYGDTGRLYCGEFVYSTFRDVVEGGAGSPPQKGVPLVGEDTRTWQWMRANNPPKKPGDIGSTIEECFRDRDIRRYIRNREFFILTVQMLYLSSYLEPNFLANGEPYQ